MHIASRVALSEFFAQFTSRFLHIVVAEWPKVLHIHLAHSTHIALSGTPCSASNTYRHNSRFRSRIAKVYPRTSGGRMRIAWFDCTAASRAETATGVPATRRAPLDAV